ncbi:MAG TPA: IS21-like element helper ATPase IstB [Gemmatimonadales bacterium]
MTPIAAVSSGALPPEPPRDLDAMLKRLHLPTIRRLHAELAVRAEAEGMSYRTYLELLVAEEIAHRAETRLRRAVRSARFPTLRTIDDFNFTFQSALRRQMLGSYLGVELVTEGRNAIFSGPSGTGKTHLVIAIAYRALQHGYEARFIPADVLIGELSHAAALGTLEEALAPYLHPHVLVLDEVGYLAHAADAANVLYRVVNERYLRGRPILVTTNKPLAAWGQVLHDGDLAEAILDRLLERGAHFEMRGRSYRTRHLKPDEVPRPDDTAN